MGRIIIVTDANGNIQEATPLGENDAPAKSENQPVEIPIRELRSFRNHPFKVIDDDQMKKLIASIQENGILTPVLVRPLPEGDGEIYELISGHRRVHAAEFAGLETVPAIIRDMTDEEATIAMVDANIQREELLPSERAFAYKMKLDAIKHQGVQTGSTQNTNHDPKQSTERKQGRKSREIMGDQIGLSSAQVSRYIRLTNLIPELLTLVDEKKIQFTVAVEISYLDKRIQKWIYEYYEDRGILRNPQIKKLRKVIVQNRSISQYKVMEILNKGLKQEPETIQISFTAKELAGYFPADYKPDQIKAEIISWLRRSKANL